MTDQPHSETAQQIIGLLGKLESEAYKRGKDDLARKLLAVLQGETQAAHAHEVPANGGAHPAEAQIHADASHGWEPHHQH